LHVAITAIRRLAENPDLLIAHNATSRFSGPETIANLMPPSVVTMAFAIMAGLDLPQSYAKFISPVPFLRIKGVKQ
jgi:hypothetical protein